MDTKTTTYGINYNHTSSEVAETYEDALELVREQALYVEGGKWAPVSAVDNLIVVRCDEADYVYLSDEDADNDDDGSRAFACVATPVHQYPNMYK